MIVPELTSSPPKRLSPRCCALLSRPVLDRPVPFLCAMARLAFLSGARGDRLDDRLGIVLADVALVVPVGVVAVLVGIDNGAPRRCGNVCDHRSARGHRSA